MSSQANATFGYGLSNYWFFVHFIMGTGKPFFKDGMHTTGLKLVSTITYPLGVIGLVYQPIKK